MSSPSADDTVDDSSDDPERTRAPDEAFCRNCGEVINARAEICPACGVRQLAPPKSSVDTALDSLLEGGNPFVAGALSAVFPGLGQLYNRELEKALVFIIGGMIAAFSVIVFVGIVLYPLVWVYAIYEAYKTAERQAEERRAAEQGRVESDIPVTNRDEDVTTEDAETKD